jgi:hypothetical protein
MAGSLVVVGRRRSLEVYIKFKSRSEMHMYGQESRIAKGESPVVGPVEIYLPSEPARARVLIVSRYVFSRTPANAPTYTKFSPGMLQCLKLYLFCSSAGPFFPFGWLFILGVFVLPGVSSIFCEKGTRLIG